MNDFVRNAFSKIINSFLNLFPIHLVSVFITIM